MCFEVLNACKDIALVVNIGKSNYLEVGRHRGMIENAHITVGSNSYEKLNIFKYLISFLTYKETSM